jgi:uncharacterized protein YebE (UPF0316 family)
MSLDPTTLSAFVITPLLIFAARLLDVSLGTIRIMMLARGRRTIAPLLGFVEILVWLLAIRQVFQHLDNWAAFFAYAAGFASGTAVGMWIEDKLAIGVVAVRIITSERADEMIEMLRSSDYGATSFNGTGQDGDVQLIFTIIKRREIDRVTEIVRQNNPRAFVTVSDVRSSSEGFFPQTGRFRLGGKPFPGFSRKGK